MRSRERPGFEKPLSAQAHAPNRPSGADKQEVQNKGESRPGRSPRSDRAVIAADRHLRPLVGIPRSRRMVNGALTAGTASGGFLAEVPGRTQERVRSGMMSKLIAAPALAAILLASGAYGAAAACGSTIAEFEAITANDAATGNL